MTGNLIKEIDTGFKKKTTPLLANARFVIAMPCSTSPVATWL